MLKNEAKYLTFATFIQKQKKGMWEMIPPVISPQE
jgi:hypothetical protein